MIASERIKYLQHRIACYSDQRAYEQLFTAVHPFLYQFALGFVKQRQPAEEIISDVFIKIWQKRETLEAILDLKVYLYVATRNIALNYIKTQKRHATERIDVEFASGIRSVYVDPEQLMITAEMLESIRKAINSLPPQCRAIFTLVREHGMKYREAAEILNIAVKTVENQMAIAVKKIADAVQFDEGRSISSPRTYP